MSESDRIKRLKFALRAFAVICTFGFYPLTVFWPSGWAWHAGQSNYLQMIIAIYATLGVFMWLASLDPVRHVILVSFSIWSSVVHAATMAVQSFANPEHFGHLYGDVPALFLVAAVLAWLSPRLSCSSSPSKERLVQADGSKDILRTYLHVQDGNRVAPVDAPDSFWPDLAAGAFPQLDEGRLMSAFTFSSAWDSWERHPAGEELVMLLSGSAVLILEESDGRRRVPLTSVGEYVLVPTGVWHTATTEITCTLLFLTPGAGTEHRPV